MEEAAFERATAQGARVRQEGPHATSTRYLATGSRLVVELSTGAKLRVPVALIEGLCGASAEDLREIKATAAGLSLHFPRIDADGYVPALIPGAERHRVQPGDDRQDCEARCLRRALQARGGLSNEPRASSAWVYPYGF